MAKDDRRVLGDINGVPIVEQRPGDHVFSHRADGDRPGEGRLVCSCGWTSESAPDHVLDLDVHIAEVNGISYEAQKRQTAEGMRKLGIAWPDPRPTN